MTEDIRHQQRLARWRLVMGKGAEQLCGGLSGEDEVRDACLGYLYDREYGSGRNVRGADGQQGGLGESELTVPDWINHVHELFPKRTIERLEQDALERYQLDEMVTNADVLSRARPNPTLLKAVLRTKHLMNQDVLKAAQHLARQVVEELMKKLSQEVKNPFLGALDRRRRSNLKIAKNLDLKTTIRRNLKHYDPERRRLVIESPIFFSRVRRHVDRWQIIILVDESGSMLDSVIHSAVTASIFFSLRTMRVHLCLFDTQVVDVTEHCTDPVETLMKVQLGGGTDIGQAVRYCSQLVENPHRTVLVLITDFCEGAPPGELIRAVKKLAEARVKLLGLASLDGQANPVYDRAMAEQLSVCGMEIAALTPQRLAQWLVEVAS